jgi:hypothetical protein
MSEERRRLAEELDLERKANSALSRELRERERDPMKAKGRMRKQRADKAQSDIALATAKADLSSP